MITFPPAKINLGLSVIGKREDGYHDLKSVFYPIPLTDILEINPGKEFSFSSSGLIINGKDENNLVIRAYALLRQKYAIPFCHIHLHKIIPMGAGLGGGSSDGAYTLRMLNDLFGLNIEQNRLMAYAEELGSDCPFFLQDKACYVEGRGEKVMPISLNLTGYFIHLIHPGIHVSTATAFSKIQPQIVSEEDYNLKVSEISQWINLIRNDFEKTVFSEFPEIKQLKDKLYKEGAIYASMSGTGSSVYGIFKEKPKKSNPNCFEFIAKL